MEREIENCKLRATWHGDDTGMLIIVIIVFDYIACYFILIIYNPRLTILLRKPNFT